MNRRLAITVLSLLALLWQGVVSAAMAPAMLAMAAAPVAVSADDDMAAMPCHGMSAEEMAAMDQSAVEHPEHRALPSCCADGHCFCALACGAAALPMPLLSLDLLPAPALKPRVLPSVIADAAAPHPFRPPIAVSV